MNVISRSPWTAAIVLALTPPMLTAADLTTIERKIAKEPVYKSKTVKYGLLVFGLEAKTRVWMVFDGDTLYLDRNGNGDLTEDGKKIAFDKDTSDASKSEYTFKIDAIRAGALIHKNFEINFRPNFARQPFYIGADIEMPGWKGKGEGGRVQQAVFGNAKPTQLADSPQNAPIMHFGGPWELAPEVNHSVYDSRGVHLLEDATTDLVVTLSTPGVGISSNVRTSYENVIPKTAYPVAEITFPPSPDQPNAPLIRERYELKERC